MLIQSFLPETNRFSVRTLLQPNRNDKMKNISVKYESFELCNELNFFDNIPRSKEVQRNCLHEEIRDQPHLTTLNLNLREVSDNQADLICKKVHRIAGIKKILDGNNIPEPVTTIRSSVHVLPDYDNEPLLVFEDIRFAANHGVVACARTNHTTFRRCSFWNTPVEVNGPDGIDEVKGLVGYPTVVFESCLFYGDILQEMNCGASVRNGGTATFLNCVFRNLGAGVTVNTGGEVTLVHCTIENSYNGVELEVKAKSVEVVNCSFNDCRMYGVSSDQAESTVITGCRFRNCADAGILSSGRSGRINTVKIKDCCIADCRDGVYFNLGKFSATLSNTTIARCTRYGILVGPCAMGAIGVDDCTVADSGKQSVFNSSQAQCRVTVDGALQEPNMVEFQPQTALLTLSARRCGQQAGVCDILCGHCGRKEEPREKFKKCGKCENVCYCSRECQKTHWKEHKVLCKLVEKEIAMIKYKF